MVVILFLHKIRLINTIFSGWCFWCHGVCRRTRIARRVTPSLECSLDRFFMRHRHLPMVHVSPLLSTPLMLSKVARTKLKMTSHCLKKSRALDLHSEFSFQSPCQQMVTEPRWLCYLLIAARRRIATQSILVEKSLWGDGFIFFSRALVRKQT